jgi:hypothetical protein
MFRIRMRISEIGIPIRLIRGGIGTTVVDVQPSTNENTLETLGVLEVAGYQVSRFLSTPKRSKKLINWLTLAPLEADCISRN